jgi:pimeloyl-ACP methyl ester carboxylesterase
MSTYILIHGAGTGAWCWDKVVPLLHQAGHQAIAFDLPGHGQDKTPVAEVTFDRYLQRTAEALAAQEEPVILVGHSLSGLLLSQIAEQYPTKIQQLVYLTAYLLQDGETVLQAAQRDTDALAFAHAILDETGSSFTYPPEKLKEFFYADCSEADIERAKQLTVPQSMQPGSVPLHVTAERFGQIPRVFIECLQDKVISPAFQKQMYSGAWPCQKVFTLETSHSPFFSAPERLSTLLLSV